MSRRTGPGADARSRRPRGPPPWSASSPADVGIGADDDVVELSGPAAARLGTRTGAAVGCPRPVTALVEHPTVRLLRAEIGALTGGRPQ